MIQDAESRLNAIAAGLGLNGAQLGYYEKGEEATLCRVKDAGVSAEDDAGGHPVLCCVKLFTAALLGMLLDEEQPDTGLSLAALLPAQARLLAGTAETIQVEHLLSHSHGLADTLASVRQVPDSLVSLFPAGRFYSYGSTGYLLLGRIIEQLSGQRYEQALYDLLLEHIVLEQTRRRYVRAVLGKEGEPVCPAGGGALCLALEDLLIFSRLFLGTTSSAVKLRYSWAEAMLQPRVSMPGWSPYIKASCYGFRDFGNGWFGHNGLSQGRLTYLRINPSRGAALCLFATGKKDNLGMLPMMLLKDSLPELARPREPPPRLDIDKVLSADHPLLGCYGDFLCRYELLLDAGRLKLRIMEGSKHQAKAGKLHECYLYPAEGEVYFLSRPWGKLTSLQLLLDAEGRSWLWSLDQVIPRAERHY